MSIVPWLVCSDSPGSRPRPLDAASGSSTLIVPWLRRSPSRICELAVPAERGEVDRAGVGQPLAVGWIAVGDRHGHGPGDVERAGVEGVLADDELDIGDAEARSGGDREAADVRGVRRHLVRRGDRPGSESRRGRCWSGSARGSSCRSRRRARASDRRPRTSDRCRLAVPGDRAADLRLRGRRRRRREGSAPSTNSPTRFACDAIPTPSDFGAIQMSAQLDERR